MTRKEAIVTRSFEYTRPYDGVSVLVPVGTRIEVEPDRTAWVHGDNVDIFKDEYVIAVKGAVNEYDGIKEGKADLRIK